jgi:uncharacterized protein YgiM (DUF1202 family)
MGTSTKPVTNILKGRFYREESESAMFHRVPCEIVTKIKIAAWSIINLTWPGICLLWWSISIDETFMIRVTLTVLITIFTVSTAFAAVDSTGDFIVTAGTLNVRLAPSTTGKMRGKLHRGQVVEVLEVKQGWARISRYYNGASEGLSGTVAHWVYAMHLATLPAGSDRTTSTATEVQAAKSPPEAQPAMPPPGEEIVVGAPILDAIKSSDDLPKYQATFAWISAKLVDSGTCKISDFRDIGGWWRSADHKPRPVYYTYCGGGSNSDRIYMDTTTGETFR